MAYRDLLDNSEINLELVEKITKDIIRNEREFTLKRLLKRLQTIILSLQMR